MPKTLPLPSTLRACVASSKSLVGDDEAAAAAGLDGGEVLEVVRDACLEKAPWLRGRGRVVLRNTGVRLTHTVMLTG